MLSPLRVAGRFGGPRHPRGRRALACFVSAMGLLAPLVCRAQEAAGSAPPVDWGALAKAPGGVAAAPAPPAPAAPSVAQPPPSEPVAPPALAAYPQLVPPPCVGFLDEEDGTCTPFRHDPATATSARRLGVGLGIGYVPVAPSGIGATSYWVSFEQAVWLGQRRRASQWVFDLQARMGFLSSRYAIAQVTLTPEFGPNFYFGPWVGLEGRARLGAMVQLGTAAAVGALLGASGAFVVRPFDDERRRLKLQFFLDTQLTLAAAAPVDSTSDAPAAPAVGLGLVYEMPF